MADGSVVYNYRWVRECVVFCDMGHIFHFIWLVFCLHKQPWIVMRESIHTFDIEFLKDDGIINI